MHSEVTGQILEDSGEGQRRPQMRTRRPESLGANRRAIDHGTGSTKFKSSQGQWAATVEQRTDGQLCGILCLLDDANTSTKLCHQTSKQRHVHLSVGRAAGVGDITAQSAVFVDRFK